MSIRDKACSDEEFIRLFRELGAAGTARELGVSIRGVYGRRKNIEKNDDILVEKFHAFENYPARVPLKVNNGVVLVGSDAHIWPGSLTAAQRGFIHLAGELKPAAVIMNGDCFDGAKISRHHPLGFQHKPSVKQELEAVDSFLHEIYLQSKKIACFWLLGNHDLRFEARLAGQASEFEGVQGFSLKDHFPAWNLGVSLWINEDVVVKHRWKGGIHATHNNTLNSGKSMVTGHLHSLKVTPFDDYNGTRWGVDTGTLSNPRGPQFEYGEDNPVNHRSGFIVLTFKNGKLLWPEVVRVVDDDHVEFRGEIIEV